MMLTRSGTAMRSATAFCTSLGEEGRRLYGQAYRTMTTAGLKEERTGSSPDVVARAILHALTARRPRARYPVGKKSRLMSTMGRVLPQYTLDAVHMRVLGLSRTKSTTMIQLSGLMSAIRSWSRRSSA
ncbi:hypothetical protein ABZW11_31075 [Nonomuraea sp. NPDC004580]|uniref:hypothetical protein n=1 Tax=Nonomuraea sp. NPDC004580 TaxID=3154552 RepID=UPI0033AA9C2D